MLDSEIDISFTFYACDFFISFIFCFEHPRMTIGWRLLPELLSMESFHTSMSTRRISEGEKISKDSVVSLIKKQMMHHASPSPRSSNWAEDLIFIMVLPHQPHKCSILISPSLMREELNRIDLDILWHACSIIYI